MLNSIVHTPTTRTTETIQHRVGGRVEGAKQHHKPILYNLVAEYPLDSILM